MWTVCFVLFCFLKATSGQIWDVLEYWTIGSRFSSVDNREPLEVSKEVDGIIGVVEMCKVLSTQQVFNKYLLPSPFIPQFKTKPPCLLWKKNSSVWILIENHLFYWKPLWLLAPQSSSWGPLATQCWVSFSILKATSSSSSPLILSFFFLIWNNGFLKALIDPNFTQ